MKNKTVIVILVALAVIVGVLYNVVTVVDTYEEYEAAHPMRPEMEAVFPEYGRALEYAGGWPDCVERKKVVVKQRPLTGEVWKEYVR